MESCRIEANDRVTNKDCEYDDMASKEASRIVLAHSVDSNHGITYESRKVETNEIVQELLSSLCIMGRSWTATNSVSGTGSSNRRNMQHGVNENHNSNVRIHNDEELVLPKIRLAALIQKLLSRERRDGVPPDLLGGNNLARRMKIVFSFPPKKAPHWLWKPLFEGLMKGSPYIDAFVEPPIGGMPMPILAWLCQWKSIQHLFFWKGQDELVSLALAAGANANIKMKNGSTPIFLAVKYGTLETVQALLHGGADLKILDSRKRSCLWNALERPIPEIVSFLLRRLPATEKFPYHANGKKEVLYQSAVDYLFATQLSLSLHSPSNPEYPWSWHVLGRPQVDDIAHVLVELGRRGVTFTPNDVTIALLSFVLRGDDPNRRRNRYPNYHQAKEPLERLARLFMGLWLPQSIQKEITDWNMTKSITARPSFCKICNSDSVFERLKLYCGHSFCLPCIKVYATRNRHCSFCPECHKPLCKDLTGLSWIQRPSIEVLFETPAGPFGPNALSSEQLKQECYEWNIVGFLTSEERRRKKILRCLSQRRIIPHVELNSVVPITDGKHVILMVPKEGPVVIPIKIKSIPVLAFISTTAYCTLVSPALIELVSLKRKELKSTGFESIVGGADTDGEFTALESFNFQVGDVSVSLDHAVEATLPDCMGIQLGVDFLQSGAWCLVDVKLEGETSDQGDSFVTVDGFGYTMNSAINRDELRYYARDGTSFRTPLLHLQPFKDGIVTRTLHVIQGNDFQECSWCCRTFPGNMVQDAVSLSHYCDDSCQSQAIKLQV